MMDTLWQDLRYGLRMLLKNPGFTAVAVLTLALGIGANTAIFTVVNAVLLRPLPFKDPDRLVMVWEKNVELARSTKQKLESYPHASGLMSASVPTFLDWREQTQIFEQVAAYYTFTTRFVLTGTGEPLEVVGARVSANFFSVLGAQPALGRTFLADEDQPGKNDVVVLGHGLWQRRFGSDPSIVGQTVTISGKRHTVVGIMPSGFHFPSEELWTPLALGINPEKYSRQAHNLDVIARLRSGVSLHQAQAVLDTLASVREQQYPESNKGWGVAVVPLHEQLVGDVRPKLLLLFGASAFVVLMACVNLAGLLLARAATRRKEMAIRAALGAGRSRLLRQLLVESVLLAVLGGTVGLLMALWGIEGLVALRPPDIPPLEDISIDLRVLCFTLASSVLTGLLFGILPAIEGSKPDLNQSLKEGGAWLGTTGGAHRIRGALVASEVALALVLLAGAGLMINTFARLHQVDPGFQPQNLLTLRLSLPAYKYSDGSRRAIFFEQVLQRIEILPGVLSAGAVYPLPFSGEQQGTSFAVEGTPLDDVLTNYRVVTPNYFRAMQIPLFKGRDFTERDTSDAPHVVIINETLARQLWPNEEPIGKRLRFYDWAPFEIVGVVGGAKHVGLDRPVGPEAYIPYAQDRRFFSTMFLVVRSAGDPTRLASSVRSQIWAVDKDQPVEDVRTMEQLMANAVAPRRFYMLLLSIFSAMALMLAAVGLYGLVNHSVAQRTHEIGIHLALGAQPSDVLKLVVGQGMVLALIGVGIGLAAAFALTRLMSSLLYGVSATDPATFAGVSLLLVGVALLACYIPAHRATKIDPIVALRYE